MSNFQWVAVAVVTIMSAARVTRLLTYDSFPPIAWVRNKFIDATDKSDRGRAWQLVAYCGYCMSFWVTASIVAWGWLSHFQDAWWIANSVFGASYAAAIVMRFDGDSDDDETEESK